MIPLTKVRVSKESVSAFKKTVWAYYRRHKRQMPWRENTALYYVIVSEIMLQQTQVSRVMQKFPAFVKRFPDWPSLAKAPTADLLREWSGLGYNRRALYLQRIAAYFTQVKRRETNRAVELLRQELEALPGIGPNTAGAIMAFAYDLPVAFIETNIRAVFIHHFFKTSRTKISDEKIMPLIEATVPKRAREWYWALMDYGSYLKSSLPNPSRRSAHHVRQKPFKGSNRELRAAILRQLLNGPALAKKIAASFAGTPGIRGTAGYAVTAVQANLHALTKEGFLVKSGNVYQIRT